MVSSSAGSALESNTILSLYRTRTAVVRWHREKEHVCLKLSYPEIRENNHRTGNPKVRDTLEAMVESGRVGPWQAEKCKLQEAYKCNAHGRMLLFSIARSRPHQLRIALEFNSFEIEFSRESTYGAPMWCSLLQSLRTLMIKRLTSTAASLLKEFDTWGLESSWYRLQRYLYYICSPAANNLKDGPGLEPTRFELRSLGSMGEPVHSTKCKDNISQQRFPVQKGTSPNWKQVQQTQDSFLFSTCLIEGEGKILGK